MKLENLLDSVNEWFCSDAGTVETFFFCVIVVIAEIVWPTIDPHGFWLLYALTVYSAITQPALARAGRISAEKTRDHDAKLEAIIRKVSDLEAQQMATIQAMSDSVGKILDDR